MNDAITTILLVVVTNWISLGELKTKDGKIFDVLEGRLQTNTVAKVLWVEKEDGIMVGLDNQPHPYIFEQQRSNWFILKSVQGPVVAEKRVELTNIYFTNIYIMTNYELTGTVKWPENGVWQTNRYTW